jgi:hypothetical protein
MTKAAGFVVSHLFHGHDFMSLDVLVKFRMTALTGKSLCSMIFMAEYHRTEARLHTDVATPDCCADAKEATKVMIPAKSMIFFKATPLLEKFFIR